MISIPFFRWSSRQPTFPPWLDATRRISGVLCTGQQITVNNLLVYRQQFLPVLQREVWTLSVNPLSAMTISVDSSILFVDKWNLRCSGICRKKRYIPINHGEVPAWAQLVQPQVHIMIGNRIELRYRRANSQIEHGSPLVCAYSTFSLRVWIHGFKHSFQIIDQQTVCSSYLSCETEKDLASDFMTLLLDSIAKGDGSRFWP